MRSDTVTSVQVPIKKLNGHWVVFVPMKEGGEQLVRVTRGLNDIEGSLLKIVIPGWLAEELAIKKGSRVEITNLNGQFNIRTVSQSS